MSDYRYIDVRSVGSVTVIKLTEVKILQDAVIDRMGIEIFRVIEDQAVLRVVIDFNVVQFLASALLGKLITLNKRLIARKGSLKLCGLQPDVRELFALTSLDRMFDIKDAVESVVS